MLTPADRLGFVVDGRIAFLPLAGIYPEALLSGRRDPNPFASARDIRGIERLARRMVWLFTHEPGLEHAIVHWLGPDGSRWGFAIDRDFGRAPVVRRIRAAAFARYATASRTLVIPDELLARA